MSISAKERFKKAVMTKQEGCPLFEGREKAEIEEIVGEKVHLEDAYPLEGEKGLYFCFTLTEYPDVFFFSCKAITNILKEASKIASEEALSINQVIDGYCIIIQDKVKTKSGNRFYPVELLDE